MSESPSNSSIKKLLDYLEQTGLLERLQLSDEDVADSIWLALQMGVEDLQSPPIFPENKQPIDSSTSNQIEENLENIPEDTLSKSPPNVDVITEESLPKEIEKTTPIQDFPFQVPAAAALQTALFISRALRPFMGKVPSATKTILDEEATASFIAERDIWLPVTKPQPERWLTLELVVEESRSSFIWRELINELQNLLENQGAFKTVRVWHLSTSNNQELQLVRRRKKGKPGQRYHPHKELIHPRGRGLVLLVSDCVSPLWQKALIHPWLKDWSEKQPTAILQLFPERLWNSTQLGRGRKLFTTALTAGVPNPKLILKNYPQWLPINWQNTLLIPVITLEIEVLKQWAKVVAGSGNAQISAFLFDLEFIKQQIIEIPPISREENKQDSEDKNTIKNKAEAMVERFFATASEPAKKLAKMMAAAPVSMQVVNLIRKTLLNEVRPVHVAEFYMGGLLKPIVENEEGQYRVYDFLPGVRQVLNDAIGRRQTIKVLDAISQYIAGEIKSPIRSFAALLTLLPTYPPEQREKILPFAQVSIEVLRNLGGEYAEFAEEIAVNISNPPPICGLSRTYNLRYEDYPSNITLTDHSLVDDPCHYFCQQARNNVKTVAQFIDDNFNKPLDRYEAIINVNVKDKYGNYLPAAWGPRTRRALFAQRLIDGRNRSYGTDITAVAHEFCHGLIQQIEEEISSECSQSKEKIRRKDHEFSEKNALEESFCDIFAVLVRNYHRDDGSYWNNPHNWLWDVGENFQEGTGSMRQLDQLLSLRFTDAGSVYGQIDWNTAKNYHELSLIHSHAFYRLMTIHNTVIDGQPLFNGEFALKLFREVLENIPTLDRFPKSRRVFEEQAQELLAPSPHIEVQLDAISQAFIDVGIE